MGYWVASTLAREAPQITYGSELIGASTIPVTLVQFQGMIDRVSAEVDGAGLKAGYAMPVASGSASGFLQLQNIVLEGAFWRAFDRIENGDTKPRSDAYRQAYRALLNELESGGAVLMGVSKSSGEGGRALPRHRGQASGYAPFDPANMRRGTIGF